jgi:cyclopropane fatty-acyl-phospholipid synthase-like methyltransferase
MTLAPGDFPEKPVLKEGSYDAILAVRVLHFFAPLKLEEAAQRMFKLLKEGGKIYVIAETPYLKNWAKYIPVYEAKRFKGDLFPGYFTNLANWGSKRKSQIFLKIFK